MKVECQSGEPMNGYRLNINRQHTLHDAAQSIRTCPLGIQLTGDTIMLVEEFKCILFLGFLFSFSFHSTSIPTATWRRSLG